MNTEELVQAAFQGDLDILEKLLNEGVDPNASGIAWTPLHAAIENENIDCVKALVRNGSRIDSDSNGMSPLSHAVDMAIDSAIQTSGSPGDEPTEVVEFLLGHGADPSSGISGAIQYGSEKLIHLLKSAAGTA